MNTRYSAFYDLKRPVREVVTKRLIGINQEASFKEGVSKMVEFNISSLVITDNGRVVGFMTDTDVKRAVAQGFTPEMKMKQVMTTDLITVNISTTIREVLETMSKNKIKHLLVTEQGKVVGIVTIRDLEHMVRQTLETYISRE
ncbi:MAG: CBS domain-containing protein [Candidatus Aminicenantes bacterium]|nr:CBS domain-containing protein [Candidatus Aminicenantes bacterium]